MEGSNHTHGVDGITLVDDEGGGSVVFHSFSWLEIIAAIIVRYARKSRNEADALISSHPLIAQPVTNCTVAVLLSHELEFHWAMLIAHGEMYWRKGVSRELPPGYWAWEENFRTEHRLAKESFAWS